MRFLHKGISSMVWLDPEQDLKRWKMGYLRVVQYTPNGEACICYAKMDELIPVLAIDGKEPKEAVA